MLFISYLLYITYLFISYCSVYLYSLVFHSVSLKLHSGQVDISSETKHHRYRDLSSSNHSDFSGSESSSFSSSGSSDNVGLKIVQALERMEKNLYMVVERLDSIEASLRNTRVGHFEQI